MAEKKKILIRIGSLRHGGAEKVLVTFLKNLPENIYEIDLLLNLYSGKYLSEVPKWINVIYLNKGEMITTNRVQDLPEKAYRVVYQKILKKFPDFLYQIKLKRKVYDIEFAAIHGMRDEILDSPLLSSKKIIWIHNDLSKITSYTPKEIRKFFGFDVIMVISEKIKDLFLHHAKDDFERAKIKKISNPLDTEMILSQAEEPLSTSVFKEHLPSFISVGTVFPQKGFDRLARVHKKLLDEGFLHQIIIIGDGYDFQNLKTLTAELGVEKTFSMLGFCDNPYPYFIKADYFVLSSRYEGFPTVLSEAIALKKNIIATEVSGAGELLQNGELGLMVENSEEGIYLGIKKALENPESFAVYQQKLKDYEMPFNLQNSVAKIREILDSL
ncbi:glycosyl transferase family 1 [Chryseobacterium sp. Leaf180]|uniref:glycosyltransferase n=1 Tax=Chryseobacterium sp. Leaf180 TaxID=1736289 RepID=UPI0006F9D3CD|nr:glycosyl transferase family 1 [Chryseobacterium sp. Leaf180]